MTEIGQSMTGLLLSTKEIRDRLLNDDRSRSEIVVEMLHIPGLGLVNENMLLRWERGVQPQRRYRIALTDYFAWKDRQA